MATFSTRPIDTMAITSKAIFLIALCLTLIGCSKSMMEDFVDSYMHDAYNVDYADEGKIFVLINHCLEAETSEAYDSCSLRQPWGPASSDEIGVEVLNFAPNEVENVLPYVREYQWITINPSFSSLGGAVVMASTQLKIMEWRGVVLVYLPQGPRKASDYSDYDERWYEANRYMCGGWQQEFPIFQSVLTGLVEGVTEPDPTEGNALRTLTVSAYSYSVHQALEVVKDNPDILFLNIAPSFGMQQFRGDPDHEYTGSLCRAYSVVDSYHELDFEKYPNPHVATYIDNVATAQVPQCLLTSFGDCTSLSFRGMSLAESNDLNIGCKDLVPIPERVRGWDPFDPATTSYVMESDETTFDCTDPADWADATCWTNSSSAYLYGSDERILKAVIANQQTRDRIRIWPVKTPFAYSDETWNQSYTTNYGENAYVGHMGFWMNGNQPDLVVPAPNIEEVQANWHFTHYLTQCTSAFNAEECPACSDADDWANGRNPDPGGAIYWVADPRAIPVLPKFHPEDQLKNNDIIFVPIHGDLPGVQEPGGLLDALDALSEKWGADVATDSGHISAVEDSAALQLVTVPEGARGVSAIDLIVDLTQEPVLECGTPTPETIHETTWTVPQLFTSGGRYEGLAGAWFDLGISWWDDANSTSCGVYGNHDISETHRILVMKLDVPATPGEGDFIGALDDPVPDIRAITAPDLQSCRPAEVIAQIYAHPASELASVKVEVDNTIGNTQILGVYDWEECVENNCDLYGTDLWYRFEWNVYDTWCNHYPNDSFCGGSETNDFLQVDFRVRAENTEGNEFFRNYIAYIDRCSDRDEDGVPDLEDNCPDTPNPDQADLDGDGLGDVCDSDRDGDGFPNESDNCPDIANPEQGNYDGDEQGDVCDSDDDNDGVLDTDDPFPMSISDPTVIIDDCDSGVTNLNIEGASFSDLIGQCGATTNNHGHFVSCLTHLATDWLQAGLITGEELARLVDAANGVNCLP